MRLSLVFEAVKAMGTAMPKDVCARVGQQLGADSEDPPFLRAIYRDLKQLADEGRLECRVFSSSGEPVSPDEADNAKNVRIEYSLLADPDEVITGWKIVREAGARLIPAALSMDWKVVYGKQANMRRHFTLLFQIQAGKVAALQLPVSDLPAKILFCRRAESARLPINFNKSVADLYGLRTLVFAASDPSMSRGQSSNKLGHAVLQIQRDHSLILHDLGSKGGSFYHPCNRELLMENLQNTTNGNTQLPDSDPFERDVEWVQSVAGKELISKAALIRLGAFRVAVLI